MSIQMVDVFLKIQGNARNHVKFFNEDNNDDLRLHNSRTNSGGVRSSFSYPISIFGIKVDMNITGYSCQLKFDNSFGVSTYSQRFWSDRDRDWRFNSKLQIENNSTTIEGFFINNERDSNRNYRFYIISQHGFLFELTIYDFSRYRSPIFGNMQWWYDIFIEFNQISITQHNFKRERNTLNNFNIFKNVFIENIFYERVWNMLKTMLEKDEIENLNFLLNDGQNVNNSIIKREIRTRDRENKDIIDYYQERGNFFNCDTCPTRVWRFGQFGVLFQNVPLECFNCIINDNKTMGTPFIRNR